MEADRMGAWHELQGHPWAEFVTMFSIAATRGRKCSTRKEDFAVFLDLMYQAKERLPMRLLAWCSVPRSKDWLDWVNQSQSEAQLAAVRKCIERGTPYGSDSWQHATAKRLGLEASMPPRGRPRIQKK